MAQLILVPTPIGNLEDITLRALSTLKTVDVIAAEDTRHSRKLLNHYQIEKPLVRLDAHTISDRAEDILSSHDSIAYITDAGTPGISDPGVELVQLALARGDSVDVLPGPTAFVPALVLSGIAAKGFVFEGFLPRKGSERQKQLKAIAERSMISIIYESPKRLKATLKELLNLCGPQRSVSISRELTKRFQSTYRGSLETVLQALATEVKGEVVIVIGPNTQSEPELDFVAKAEALALAGIKGKDLRTVLKVLGAPRNTAYELSLRFGV